MITLEKIIAFACEKHDGQLDKIGELSFVLQNQKQAFLYI